MIQNHQKSFDTQLDDDNQKSQTISKVIKFMKKVKKQKQKEKDVSMKIKQSNSYICHLRHFNSQNIPNLNPQKINTHIFYLSISTFDCIYQIKKVDARQQKFQPVFAMKTSMPIINSYIQFDKKMNFVSLSLAYINGDIQSVPFSSQEDLKKLYKTQIHSFTCNIQPSQLSVNQRINSGYRYLNDLKLEQEKDISYQLALQTICQLYRRGDNIIALNFKGELKKIKAKKMQLCKEKSIFFQQKVSCAQIISCKIKQSQQNKMQQDMQQKRQQKLCICFNSKKHNPFLLDLNSQKKEYEKDLTLIKEEYQRFEQGGEIFTKVAFNYNKNQIITYSKEAKTINYFSIEFQGRNTLCFLKTKIQYKDQVQSINCLQNYLMLIGGSKIFIYQCEDHRIISEKKNLQQLKNGIMMTAKDQGILSLISKGFLIDENNLNKEQRKTTTIHIYQVPYYVIKK